MVLLCHSILSAFMLDSQFCLLYVSQGDGTRSGSGKCKCHSGYNGELCNKCKDGFYEEYSNETHTSCKGMFLNVRFFFSVFFFFLFY